jgi:hypothetical protein
VKIVAPKRENANKESVVASEAAKGPRPSQGELMLGFMGQVKSVFSRQEYEFSEEHISTSDAPRVERVPEESLFDAETTNLCFFGLFVRCRVGCVVAELESS